MNENFVSKYYQIIYFKLSLNKTFSSQKGQFLFSIVFFNIEPPPPPIPQLPVPGQKVETGKLHSVSPLASS
jgi:hypothetical protein